MDIQQLEEIKACLTGNRMVFQYIPDGYALQLLGDYIGDGMSIAQLRQSPYGKLLNKAIVREALAHAGNGRLEPWHLQAVAHQYNQHKPLNFVLTLSEWGTDDKQWRAWHQLSRTGYHLVLQLNFARDHHIQLQSLLKPFSTAPFSSHNHPVALDGRYETFAWARIDLDFACNQALIEEIQSDWVKEAYDPMMEGVYGENALRQYQREVLQPYARVWDEAMLAAALKLIRHDLGIREVFYNSYDTGNKLKGLAQYKSYPPRSLYTELPKRFCFASTSEAPDFLKSVRFVHYLQRQGQARWFKLPNQELNNGQEKGKNTASQRAKTCAH